jgi:hypothetical protein
MQLSGSIILTYGYKTGVISPPGTKLIALNGISPYAIDLVVLYWYTGELNIPDNPTIEHNVPGQFTANGTVDVPLPPPKNKGSVLYDMAVIARVYGDEALEHAILAKFLDYIENLTFGSQEEFLKFAGTEGLFCDAKNPLDTELYNKFKELLA